jgi:hypothetical protein
LRRSDRLPRFSPNIAAPARIATCRAARTQKADRCRDDSMPAVQETTEMGSLGGESGGFMQKLLSVDFYRKLPDDVAQATKTGAILSWAAAFIMGLLFLTELSSYLSGVVITSFDIDSNSAQDIEIFLKVTTPHVACQFLSIDASNVLGTRRTNISKSLQKHAPAPPASLIEKM